MVNLNKIFVNLPVQDLPRSMDFFKALGYTFNLQFTDENAACLELGNDTFVMLLNKAFFEEAIISLSVDSRDAVDVLIDKALAAGGSPSKVPVDMGFMYNRSFLDLDGHQWEVLYTDQSH